MSVALIVIMLVIACALAFDFTNGFHDTANAMATSIATKALPPRIAVGLCAVLNTVGAFISLAVATTIVKGIVESHAITVETVLAGVVGAIIWNLITWYFALPSSSSHAIIGGLVGAAIVTGGFSAVEFGGVISKVLLPALISPTVAFLASMCATRLAFRITRNNEAKVNAGTYRHAQIVSASMVALAHGTNDAQKTMGVITLALITGGFLGADAGVPDWVVIACALAIGTGTYIGAWRVIRTLGKGLTEIVSTQGFAAECSSAAAILISSHFGYPLSTTHVCSGSVMGAGAGKRIAGVKWSLALTMLGGWLITLPCAAILAGAASAVAGGIGGLGGPIIAVAALAVIAGGIVLATQRTKITADNVNEEVDPNHVFAIHTKESQGAAEAEPAGVVS